MPTICEAIRGKGYRKNGDQNESWLHEKYLQTMRTEAVFD
ncbi:hypothetical protein PAMC26577_06545 [Caballeronia sordidicola]|uniref:Uncharacterized protein n=1 Tax=Caballeronia sordidicola TaxID=196367 RepID=A0A242N4G5_CABSO|nr:hypothetical protein PAMC26577_06545 [Caballeronia sordidicola]